MKNTRNLTYASLFLAFSVLLPMIFHFFGGAGIIFLPMHIPVLLAGFIIGSAEGFIVGLLAPLLGFLFSGMPAVPAVYFMLFEVPAYGFFAGLLYRKKKLGLYASLLLAMTAGRIFLAAALYLLQPLLGLSLSREVYLLSALTTGLPGILIQLIFLPPTVKLLEKAGEYNARNSY